MVVTQRELEAMSGEERRELAAALVAAGCGDLAPPPAALRRLRRFVQLIGVGVILAA